MFKSITTSVLLVFFISVPWSEAAGRVKRSEVTYVERYVEVGSDLKLECKNQMPPNDKWEYSPPSADNAINDPAPKCTVELKNEINTTLAGACEDNLGLTRETFGLVVWDFRIGDNEGYYVCNDDALSAFRAMAIAIPKLSIRVFKLNDNGLFIEQWNGMGLVPGATYQFMCTAEDFYPDFTDDENEFFWMRGAKKLVYPDKPMRYLTNDSELFLARLSITLENLSDEATDVTCGFRTVNVETQNGVIRTVSVYASEPSPYARIVSSANALMPPSGTNMMLIALSTLANLLLTAKVVNQDY